ncbi:MAG: serine/threonine protein kinase [Actinobacteria bacterium]|nr:serine/threonine protein kinase [Actinomycetota bacterium]
MPEVGTEFAGYRLEGLIGHGGMSIVYRAQHLRLERTVALKLLMPELSQDDSFRQRFMRESRLAASLDHPNVIPIYEAGDQDGVFYIAMRFVGGSTLKAILEQEGPLPATRTASLMSQVANALHAAHEDKGLVHRDVKPANILVVPGHGHEGGDHVYLSDFGIAKQRAAGGGLTKTGMFVGTADYASPEQIEGRELDRRADVYALGCVLYECLTAGPTYEKDSEVALMYAHLLEPPPAVTSKRPDLSPDVDAVVAKAMAKSADDRYSTAPEFAAAMRKALIGTETRRTQQSDQARVPETVLTAPTPPAAPPPAPPPAAGQPEQPPSRRRPRPLFIALGAALLAAIGGGVAAALLLTGGGGSTKTGTLLDVLVPTEIAKSCTTQKVPASGAVETDICTPPSGAASSFPDTLQLSFYPDADAVLAAYAAEKEKSGVADNMGRCDRTQWKGEGVWRHTDGKTGGHRVCYTDGNGNAVVGWTHEKLGSANHANMFAVASEPGRGAQSALFSWWNPIHQVVGKCRAKIAEQTCIDTIDKVSAK